MIIKLYISWDTVGHKEIVNTYLPRHLPVYRCLGGPHTRGSPSDPNAYRYDLPQARSPVLLCLNQRCCVPNQHATAKFHAVDTQQSYVTTPGRASYGPYIKHCREPGAWVWAGCRTNAPSCIHFQYAGSMHPCEGTVSESESRRSLDLGLIAGAARISETNSWATWAAMTVILSRSLRLLQRPHQRSRIGEPSLVMQLINPIVGGLPSQDFLGWAGSTGQAPCALVTWM